MEGVLLIVRKGHGRHGELEGMITVFHRDFFSYTPAGSRLRGGEERRHLGRGWF